MQSLPMKREAPVDYTIELIEESTSRVLERRTVQAVSRYQPPSPSRTPKSRQPVPDTKEFRTRVFDSRRQCVAGIPHVPLVHNPPDRMALGQAWDPKQVHAVRSQVQVQGASG